MNTIVCLEDDKSLLGKVLRKACNVSMFDHYNSLPFIDTDVCICFTDGVFEALITDAELKTNDRIYWSASEEHSYVDIRMEKDTLVGLYHIKTIQNGAIEYRFSKAKKRTLLFIMQSELEVFQAS